MKSFCLFSIFILLFVSCDEEQSCPALPEISAGNDMLELVEPSIRLDGTENIEEIEAVWEVVQGEGGEINRPLKSNTMFKGVPGEVYTLRYTFTNECSEVSDEVTISFCQVPERAYAGPDRIVGQGTITTLNAEAPEQGNGFWEIISGEGGQIANTMDANSQFTGQAGIAYQLRWTVELGCGTKSDQVNIRFFTQGSFTDDRDGKIYGTVKIGKYTWFARNLDYNAPGSFVAFNPMFQFEGRYYSWAAAMNLPLNFNNQPYNGDEVQGVAPDGWRIPSVDEIQDLIDNLDKGQDGYSQILNGGGSGFDMLMAGFASANGSVTRVQQGGFYSRNSEVNTAEFAFLIPNNSLQITSFNKSRAWNVRPVRD
ncbi:FISUMP domain-containing protein [Fulvivirgaceae bacterium LMO-SS25]